MLKVALADITQENANLRAELDIPEKPEYQEHLRRIYQEAIATMKEQEVRHAERMGELRDALQKLRIDMEVDKRTYQQQEQQIRTLMEQVVRSFSRYRSWSQQQQQQRWDSSYHGASSADWHIDATAPPQQGHSQNEWEDHRRTRCLNCGKG